MLIFLYERVLEFQRSSRYLLTNTLEGGEGVVPEIISREQYNRAQDIIGRLAK